MISIDETKKLPDSPGVYFFMGEKGEILYIGRATSLRDRVRSYFRDDVIHTRGALIVDMVTKSVKIDFVEADSVLDAIILEANLIKKYQPGANIAEKDDKSFNYVVFTKEDFPKILLVRGKDLEEGHFKEKTLYVFGPYTEGGVLKEGMKIIRKIFPYRDAKCAPLQGKPCFNRQIGLCPGVCSGEVTKEEYKKTIANIALFFEGKKNKVLKTLERDMKEYAKRQEFEKAAFIKRKIFSLTHIQDLSLIQAEEKESLRKNSSLKTTDYKLPATFRIEAYDVAHLSGKSVGGVMVVLEGRKIKKSDYRLFKIRTAKGADDVGSLKEVLERRLKHPEWQYPNVIVVDGGISQKNFAEEVLKRENFDIAVIAVQKNEKHRPEKLLGDEEIVKEYKKEILLLNSEAHRFAIKYHRKMRRKSFL